MQFEGTHMKFNKASPPLNSFGFSGIFVCGFSFFFDF